MDLARVSYIGTTYATWDTFYPMFPELIHVEEDG